MEEIKYMDQVLANAPGTNAVSFWGGALMLLNALNKTNSLDYELAKKLEAAIHQRLEEV